MQRPAQVYLHVVRHPDLHPSMQDPVHVIEQVPLQVAVHLLLHPIHSIGVSAAFAKTELDVKTTAPKIGKATLAAFLKNSRLD